VEINGLQHSNYFQKAPKKGVHHKVRMVEIEAQHKVRQTLNKKVEQKKATSLNSQNLIWWQKTKNKEQSGSHC
jgi:hypothetical protein